MKERPTHLHTVPDKESWRDAWKAARKRNKEEKAQRKNYAPEHNFLLETAFDAFTVFGSIVVPGVIYSIATGNWEAAKIGLEGGAILTPIFLPWLGLDH